jgi:hypothetical protein
VQADGRRVRQDLQRARRLHDRARGCYCGQQPVIGVAKSAGAAAAACEKQAGENCGLGCANFPGQVAEDGKSPDDGGTLEVACTANKCVTVVR